MFQQMITFIAVVEEHTFLRAAEQRNISQSAVSQQIQALERKLGVQLLRRTGRSFELTEAGEHFYQRSKAIIQEVNQLTTETVQIARQSHSTLRVGYLQTFGSTEFLQAVSAFSQAFPQIGLDIAHGDHEHLYRLLTDDQVDLVFSDQRRALSGNFHNLYLTESRLLAVLSTRALPQGERHIDIASLSKLPCILVASKDHREDEEDYHRNTLGVRSRFICANTLEEAEMLVVANKGFLLTDARGSQQFSRDLSQALPVTHRGQPMTRKYYAFWNRDNSGYYVETFAQLLKQQFGSV
ncbi:LysR family transcriptional regulator [Bifidobacterium aemilianum]|uniref:LysR family transcriptional regulator n=1 Tax=Bifidobacterium aemilianum TaxID=2493120 RepID=A0A366K7V5_9BIFI|nr:LysR family transcriptional regulator [Bifidobacterium aemilianum]RBP97816.1 LysR family transcriptional regulator [Bifidobacterium aemilianum]